MKNQSTKLVASFLALLMCLSVFAFSPALNDAKAAGEVFIIDPGHGGSDPGALSADQTRYESHDVLRLSLRVGEIVSQYSTVAFTRTTDTTLSLQERSNIANAGGHQYLISIHRNSYNSTTANGLETYYYSGLSSTSPSAKFATAVQNNVVAVAPFRNRGVKTQDFHMVREPNMPSCLIEVGFMKNANDTAIFDQYFEQIAQGIAAGMLAQINITIGQSTPVTNKLEGNSYIDMGKDFYARVKHVGSGKYFTDVDGNVETADFSGTNNQVWHFMRQSGGRYLIGNVSTKGFWDVENGSYENNTNLIANKTVTYASNQLFYIYYINNNFYFMPAGGDIVVDVTASTGNVKVYGTGIGETETSNARIARSMEIEYLSIYDSTMVRPDLGDSFTATIKNIDCGLFLTPDGEKIYGKEATGADDQEWIFTRLPNGAYTICNVSTNTAITVPDSRLSSGVMTHAALSGDKSQSFFIIKKDDVYYIKSSYSYLALDMAANSHTINIHNTGTDPAQFAAQRYEIIITSVTEESELVLKEDSALVKDGGDLYKVEADKTVAYVLSNFENTQAVIWDKDGNALSDDDKVGTGCTVNLIVNDTKVDSLTIIVKGDLTGEGIIDSTDYLRIKNNFLNTLVLDPASEKAADVDNNGLVDATDCLRVKRHFLGTYNIFE